MRQSIVVVLKALLAILLLGALASQVFVLPLLAGDIAARNPEAAWLQVPGLVVAILVVACIEVCFIATWGLLSMVPRDRIFQDRAFVLVDVIIGAILAATVLVIGTAILLSAIGLGGPATMYLLAAGVLGIALALLVVVMRGLLRKATQLQQDLAEVV